MTLQIDKINPASLYNWYILKEWHKGWKGGSEFTMEGKEEETKEETSWILNGWNSNFNRAYIENWWNNTIDPDILAISWSQKVLEILWHNTGRPEWKRLINLVA